MTATNPVGPDSTQSTEPHDDHGSTPAAWTAVTIITLAFAIGTLAVVLANWPLFWVGVGLVLVGALVGRVMQSLGLGKQGRGKKSARVSD